MKIFISQPMNGLSVDEIKAERERILKKFNEFHGFHFTLDDVINPIERKFRHPATRLNYLTAAIDDLARADLVIFSKDSVIARGCKIEYEVTRLYSDCYNWIICQETKDGFVKVTHRRNK